MKALNVNCMMMTLFMIIIIILIIVAASMPPGFLFEKDPPKNDRPSERFMTY